MRITVLIVLMHLFIMSVVFGVDYTSPYAITLDANITDWTIDIPDRIQTANEQSLPEPGDWYDYDAATYSAIGHFYGATMPQLYSTDTPAHTLGISSRKVVNAGAIPGTPTGVDTNTYQQQRVLSVANGLIGTPYQHHHNPTWNAYANGFTSNSADANYWDWIPVSDQEMLKTTDRTTIVNPWKDTYGRGTEGIDCSNFASYIYNTALGIQMNSSISILGEEDVGSLMTNPIIGADGEYIQPGFINGPNYASGAKNVAGDLDGLIGIFRPGDLLFMTAKPNDPMDISHVIIWLGLYGTLEDGTSSGVPLVLSSHDNTPAIFDGDGNLPPPGVEILPFTADNWFYQNYSHSMRIIDPTSVPEPGHYAALVGAFVLFIVVQRRRYA